MKRGGGSPDEAGLEQLNAIPIPHPINLALFGHKQHFIDSIRGAHAITGWLKSEQGAEPPVPLTLTTGLDFIHDPALPQWRHFGRLQEKLITIELITLILPARCFGSHTKLVKKIHLLSIRQMSHLPKSN